MKFVICVDNPVQNELDKIIITFRQFTNQLFAAE